MMAVLELCTKCGCSSCRSVWDRHTFVVNVWQMTWGKLIFSSVFDHSGRHLYEVVLQILYGIWCKYFQSVQRCSHFTKYSIRLPSAILDMLGKSWDYPWRPVHGGYPVWKLRHDGTAVLNL